MIRPTKHEMEELFHPAANIFPLMDESQFTELRESIKSDGLQNAVVFLGDKIIDGRNRYLACKELGIEPTEAELDAEYCPDPIKYVLQQNLHRRHLTESQRSMVAHVVEKLLKPAARERKRKNVGRPKKDEEKLPQNLGAISNRHSNEAAEQAAAALNVSRGSVNNARIVFEKGSDELIEAVKEGEVSVSKAAKVAKEKPKEQQLAAAKEPRKKPEKKTPFQHMREWWSKASETERRAFYEWAQEQLEEAGLLP